jgi:hypothetical protein
VRLAPGFSGVERGETSLQRMSGSVAQVVAHRAMGVVQRLAGVLQMFFDLGIAVHVGLLG